jgi:hypothetical protein
MELVPMIVVTVVGAIGFFLMLSAFVMVGRRGGWPKAMKIDARGHWPTPRLLMCIGALSSVALAFIFVPGMVPWWDYSSPYAVWAYGVVFGFLLGFGLRPLLLIERRPSESRSGDDRGSSA